MLDTCQLIYRRDVIGLQKKTFMISTAHSAATLDDLLRPDEEDTSSDGSSVEDDVHN